MQIESCENKTMLLVRPIPFCMELQFLVRKDLELLSDRAAGFPRR